MGHWSNRVLECWVSERISPILEHFVRDFISHSVMVKIPRGQVNSVIPVQAGIQVHFLSEHENAWIP
jgi:hypothetical protein